MTNESPKKYRLLLTGGGTGGHVYPALAVARALDSDPRLAGRIEFLYVGTKNGMESPIVEKAGLPFAAIPAAAFRGRDLVRIVKGVFTVVAGLADARALLNRQKAEGAPIQAVLATGGYVCVPMVLAAWLDRLPIVIYLPDIEPGLAVKFLSRFATRIAVTLEEASRFFDPKKVVVTGYPVRAEVLAARHDESRRELGFSSDGFVLLVFGGSRGAHTINVATFSDLEDLLSLGEVIHVHGGHDTAQAQKRKAELPEAIRERYHPSTFLHSDDMARALAAADLAVSRSGASVLGEFTALGLPSIQVPYPYAGAHQKLNAKVLADRGAAIMMDNAEVAEGKLTDLIRHLASDPKRRKSMAESARALSRPLAARRIGSELLKLAGMPGVEIPDSSDDDPDEIPR